MVSLLPIMLQLQMLLKRPTYSSWPKRLPTKIEASKLRCFFLLGWTIIPLKRLVESKSGKKTRLFFWRKSRLNIEKWNFLENSLCYINQGYISTVKGVGGELAMYTHIHILGQLVVTANQPRNLDQYTPAKNEVKPCSLPVWQSTTGEFQDMAMKLSYIIFWGDVEEFFLSYVYSEKKSLVLYLVAKEKISNAFILTNFKKHFHEIMNERWHNKEFYDIFFYLPSTTDRKEKTTSTETMWISVL